MPDELTPEQVRQWAVFGRLLLGLPRDPTEARKALNERRRREGLAKRPRYRDGRGTAPEECGDAR